MNPDVLLVDDSLTVRMDVGEALTDAGFAVHACASLAAARDALSARDRPFDLLVLDLLLPDGEGVELIELLQRHSTGIDGVPPVLWLALEADVQRLRPGWQGRGQEFLGKPYERGDVLARARSLSKGRSGGAIGPGRGGRLLIVDDSATFRAAMQTLFEGQGYSVVTAATGEEGLHLAAQVQPLAVIVDGGLPGINGETVVRRLRLDPTLRRTPIMLLTGSNDVRHELGALEAGADAFVSKDADDTMILARLAAVLRSSSASPGATSAPTTLGPKCILAVDDSLTYRQALADELRSEGYAVFVAESGQEALGMLAIQPVDCVLLDLIMPGLSGTQTCQAIRSSPGWRDLPILMLTAMEDRDAMIAGMNAGADDYISKSSGFDVLKARLRAQLRRKQFEDETRHIREELLQRELDATEARAARELAETRAMLLADVQEKNEALRLSNAALEVSRGEAEKASQAKSSFLAAMSHEIRTPMNGVIGMAEVLSRSPMPEDQADAVRTIRDSAVALLGIIDDILDFSKIEAGRIQMEHVPFSLDQVLEGVCTSLDAVASRSGVSLSVFIDPRLPDRQCGDPTRLRQVVYNIVGNALKFSAGRAEPGRVEVRVEFATKGNLVIQVTDNGIGIAPQVLETLFTPFTQAETSTTRRFGGTGLGLAISAQLVRLMSGTLHAESTLGRGSTFSVCLPIVESGGIRPARPLNGVDVLLLAGPDIPASDIQLWLESAGARVHTLARLSEESLQVLLRPLSVLVHTAEGGQRHAREVLLTRSRGSDDRRVNLNNLRRGALLHAVALAAGIASPERKRKASLPPPEEVSAPSVADARERGQLLLVAEDNPVNRKVILRQLALLGFAAEVADTGTEALALWRRGTYALLLTDLHMPEMDGYELTDAIRREEAQGARRGARLPILALTANALQGADSRARAVGMDDYLTKPLLLGQLRAALRRWLPAGTTSSLASLPPVVVERAARAVDLDELRNLIGPDEAALREVLVEFLTSTRSLATTLEAAVLRGDGPHAAALAHQLKSAARALGAFAFSDVCIELENAGAVGDTRLLAERWADFQIGLAPVLGAVEALLRIPNALALEGTS